MGEDAASTVKEIEEVRDRLGDNLEELEDRLPEPAVWGKRLIGMAVGGGMGGSVLWFAVRRLRRSRAKPDPEIKNVVELVPDEVVVAVARAMEEGRWKRYAAAGAGIWLVVRLAELRALRRMHRQPVAG